MAEVIISTIENINELAIFADPYLIRRKYKIFLNRVKTNYFIFIKTLC